MNDNIIYWKIPSLNAIKESNRVKQVFLNENHPFNEAYLIAKEKKIPVKLINQQKLNELLSFNNHQGIV